MNTAIYLYALMRSGRLPALEGSGLDEGTPLHTFDDTNVTAVYSIVSLDDFSGPAAEANLTDLTWVGPRAVRHGEIVNNAMHYSPVLPARFGTLFSGKESLQRLIQNNHSRIVEFFDHIEGKEEWAVKAFFHRTHAAEKRFEEQRAARSDGLEGMSQGLRYVKERQMRAEVERVLSAWMKSVLAALAEQLTSLAIEYRKRETRAGNPGEKGAEQVANWAFLLQGSEAEDFSTRINRANETLHDSGLSFDLSGPWPPYSFTPQLETEA